MTLIEKFKKLGSQIYGFNYETEEVTGHALDKMRKHIYKILGRMLEDQKRDIFTRYYKLCVEFKRSEGTSLGECVWAMTNHIKDLHEVNDQAHDEEIYALLDVIMLSTMESRKENGFS